MRRWVKNGELRAIDIGRQWRIAPDDLDHFLCRHATKPQSETPESGREDDALEPEPLQRNPS